MEYKITSNNGMPIYYYPQCHLHTFDISLYIKTGCMFEDESNNGIAHLFEHIIFRNTNFILNGDFLKILDSKSLSFKACTYNEFVLFEITGLISKFDCAAEIISKVFEEIKLPIKEINIEKNRIKAEILEEEYSKSIDYYYQKNVWKDTPLSRPILGNCTVLNKISRKHLNEFKRENLTKNNAFLYVTGAFDEKHIEYLSHCVSKYDVCNDKIVRTNFAPHPNLFNKRNNSITVKSSYYCMVQLGFDIDNTYFSKAIIDMIYDILFSGESSKFYQELSEKRGLIYSFDARTAEYINISNMFVKFEVDFKKLEDTIRIIVQVLNDLKNKCDELSIQKEKCILDSEKLMDSPQDLNWVMGFNCHILNEKYSTVYDRADEYNRITEKDICFAASRIFKTDNLTVVVKGRRNCENIVRQLFKLLDE